MRAPLFALRLVLAMALLAVGFFALHGVGKAHVIGGADCHRHIGQPSNIHLNGCYQWHGRVCVLTYTTGASDQIYLAGFEHPRQGMTCE